MKKGTLVWVVAAATALMANTAFAAAPAAPDGAEVVTYIAAAGVTMGLIASSKFLMQLGIKAWHWIRQALS